MKFEFHKYQGTGNDFVLIDDRAQRFDPEDQDLIAAICDRRFGVGADGLILLRDHPDLDFEMVYFNSDGAPSSMCGNGGRCIVRFAASLGLVGEEVVFMAVDGPHSARVTDGVIALQMGNVATVKTEETHAFLDTGSPHHVQWVDDVAEHAVVAEGRRIRNQVYGKPGANVNFVEVLDATRVKVRTYERGVEDETLSCGTGVTAVAIAMHATGKTQKSSVEIVTPGGELVVDFRHVENGYTDVWLTGPAQSVFKGKWL